MEISALDKNFSNEEAGSIKKLCCLVLLNISSLKDVLVEIAPPKNRNQKKKFVYIGSTLLKTPYLVRTAPIIVNPPIIEVIVIAYIIQERLSS
jgi:hypothetical protein